MKKLKIEVTVDNKVVFSKEDVFCSVMFEAQRAMEQHVWPRWQDVNGMQEGQKGQKNAGTDARVVRMYDGPPKTQASTGRHSSRESGT